MTARNEIKVFFEKFLKEESLKYRLINTYSSPTRLTVLIKDVPEKIKIAKHGLTPNLVLSRQLDDDTADHILKKKMIKVNSILSNLNQKKHCLKIY